ncbi:hypothetical protein VTK73DRAFT_2173 [Phialemonium thermophilum]|uniref:Sulphur transport domain-containing protein n=1 Tax=Phialemonium thermophilum TaxID=223376 RepID=A0ABR3VSH3_9PEZI
MGVVAGAWLLPRLAPGLVGEIVAVRVPPLSAFLGGLLMVVGSRMAGGCTSGHGISGMSLLSTSSVITMGTAIGWGMIVANVLSSIMIIHLLVPPKFRQSVRSRNRIKNILLWET